MDPTTLGQTIKAVFFTLISLAILWKACEFVIAVREYRKSRQGEGGE